MDVSLWQNFVGFFVHPLTELIKYADYKFPRNIHSCLVDFNKVESLNLQYSQARRTIEGRLGYVPTTLSLFKPWHMGEADMGMSQPTFKPFHRAWQYSTQSCKYAGMAYESGEVFWSNFSCCFGLKLRWLEAFSKFGQCSYCLPVVWLLVNAQSSFR